MDPIRVSGLKVDDQSTKKGMEKKELAEALSKIASPSRAKESHRSQTPGKGCRVSFIRKGVFGFCAPTIPTGGVMRRQHTTRLHMALYAYSTSARCASAIMYILSTGYASDTMFTD